MRQSRRTEGTYQKPKKQTVAFASTKKADSTRLRFVTHLHPRFRLSCNHYTQENLFRKDKEKQKSNICSCFYFFLLHLPLQSCIYFFIQRNYNLASIFQLSFFSPVPAQYPSIVISPFPLSKCMVYHQPSLSKMLSVPWYAAPLNSVYPLPSPYRIFPLW